MNAIIFQRRKIPFKSTPIVKALCGWMLLLFVSLTHCRAQVPQIIGYQGRVAVQNVNFNGTGQFKFALVSGNGSTTYWSNDGTSTAGAEPQSYITVTVVNGLYSVLLGDAHITNMTPIPLSTFATNDVWLRIWFSDGINGSQLVTPDQKIAAVGYAMMSATVPDGAITTTKIAPAAITTDKIATGAVQSANIAAGAIGSAQIAPGAVSASSISGILPVSNGGTGVNSSSSSALLSSLGLDRNILVFTHMKYSNLYGGLYVSTSTDGVNWVDLNGGASCFTPASGFIGDITPYYDVANKVFYAAYTEGNHYGCCSTAGFGLASSADLIHWNFVAHVDMSGAASVDGICENPVFFVDASGNPHIFVTCSATPSAAALQIYETHPPSPSNLSSGWSAPALVQTPTAQGFNEWFVFLSPDDSNFHAVYVDFNFYGTLRHATAPSLLGPWTQTVTYGLYGSEGPFVLRAGTDASGLSRWRLYFELNNASNVGYLYMDLDHNFARIGDPHNITNGVSQGLNGKAILVNTALGSGPIAVTGSMAAQDSDSVQIAGGTISNVSLSGVSATNGMTVSGGALNLPTYTVANLPKSPAIGATAIVTDAAAITFGSTPVGGSNHVVPVFYNGANWVEY